MTDKKEALKDAIRRGLNDPRNRAAFADIIRNQIASSVASKGWEWLAKKQGRRIIVDSESEGIALTFLEDGHDTEPDFLEREEGDPPPAPAPGAPDVQRVDDFMSDEDLTAAAELLRANVDWTRLPRLASIFQHRPSVNLYWHELVALTLISLGVNADTMNKRNAARRETEGS